MSVSAIPHASINPELLDILAGSDGYRERIKELQAAKAAAEMALAELKLGQSAAAALDEVRQRQAEVEAAVAHLEAKRAAFRAEIAAVRDAVEAAR